MASASEEQEYLGYGEETPEQLEKKPKITFKEVLKDARNFRRRVKPGVYAVFHFFLAFGAGSLVNYLVAQGLIKPAHVTQIVVFMLVFIFLRLNTLIGDKK